MTGFNLQASGTAVICCVHDRPKREVTTEQQVAELGLQVGQIYNPAQHRLHLCACCQNLFVDPSDEPRYCRRCQAPATHQINGRLPEPTGEI